MASDSKAEPGSQRWSKETVRCVNILFFLFLLVIIIVITAVIVAMGDDDPKPKSSNATNATNATDANVTVSSTEGGSSSDDAGDIAGKFVDLTELELAVDDYLMYKQVSDVTKEYGESIQAWDVSAVEDFSSLFSATRNVKAAGFNEDISSWNVGMAKDMTSMFQGAASFEGIGLGTWNVSSVLEMDYMFANTTVFNGDLGAWNVANVKKFDAMFWGTSGYTGIGLSSWTVSPDATMFGMFAVAAAFNPLSTPSWAADSVFSTSRSGGK
jgi:Mycoplasma protein of unknown function, DUF285